MFMFLKTVDEKPIGEKAKAVCPQFKPKWWYKPKRLDARPMIWSLRNKPEDWQMHESGYHLIHMPSQHHYATDPRMEYRPLPTSDCGCGTAYAGYQPFQTFSIGRAVRSWLRWNDKRKELERQVEVNLNAQFHSHF